MRKQKSVEFRLVNMQKALDFQFVCSGNFPLKLESKTAYGLYGLYG